MRVTPASEVHLLDRHLERLSRSARFFSFECDLAGVREAIVRAVLRSERPVGLRLTLTKNGEISVESNPLPVGYVRSLKLSSETVNSSDVFLCHKTTNRGIYEKARKECDDQTDVILVNERGEATETTIMNIAVFRDGRWTTPLVSCGLLPGVMREELVASGEIVEGIVPAKELKPGELIRCFNALRGVCEARLV
jgi:para-aminobenzoate synthetase/4-amino-4-deoxychorismate lyase